jgi:hypothetical protein
MNTDVKDTAEAMAIGRALRAAIPIGRELGWTSERTFHEAEAYAAANGHRDERRDPEAAGRA